MNGSASLEPNPEQSSSQSSRRKETRQDKHGKQESQWTRQADMADIKQAVAGGWKRKRRRRNRRRVTGTGLAPLTTGPGLPSNP